MTKLATGSCWDCTARDACLLLELGCQKWTSHPSLVPVHEDGLPASAIEQLTGEDPTREAALRKEWEMTEPIETDPKQACLERMALIIYDAIRGRYFANGSPAVEAFSARIADRIASDAAAGDDPDTLRYERDRNQASRRWHMEKQQEAERERDEARAEVSAKAGAISVLLDNLGRVNAERDEARAALDEARAEVGNLKDAIALAGQRYAEALDRIRTVETAITASVAREAAMREALDRIRVGDPEIDCLEHAADYIAAIAADALAVPSPAAEAMVRVVEALAKDWPGIKGGLASIDLIDAYEAYSALHAQTGADR